MLNGEDSKSDLILFLLELIKKINADNFYDEGQLVVYILKSLKNEFIKLSKAKSKKACSELLVDELFDEQEPFSGDDPMETIDLKIFITNLLTQNLTAKEKIILYKFFIEDKPIRQIAEEEHISRQAVNQTKKVALEKLQRNISKDTLQWWDRFLVI